MKRNFLTGLVILIPIALTIIIVLLVVDILTQPFMGGMEQLLGKVSIFHKNIPLFSSEQALRAWSRMAILVSLFLFVFILGIFARWFVFNTLVNLGDKILHRIPIINKLYKTLKEVTKVIFTSDSRAFKDVVMVPFPNHHTFCLGLLSRDSPNLYNEPAKKELTAVFIPTTPNPTTGYLIQYPKDEIKKINMTVEEALKFIVSCGMVSPGEINAKFLSTKSL
ncbi:MAG: hypothetical protein S4CHLAM7_14660 [Chlamydiae bacterium]|nr:hypothetical protein [Chlamydiota bacterium]